MVERRQILEIVLMVEKVKAGGMCARVILRSWTNCWSQYLRWISNLLDTFFSAPAWKSKSVTCEFHWAMKIFHLVKVWERKHWDEVRLWLVSPLGPGPALAPSYAPHFSPGEQFLCLHRALDCTTGKDNKSGVRIQYNAHRAKTAH